MKAITALRYTEPVELAINADDVLADRTLPEIRRAADRLSILLAASPEGTVVPVSLGEGMITASCIAEVLVPALQTMSEGKVPGRFIVVVDPGERHDFEVDSALLRQSERLGGKFVVVRRGSAGNKLLGPFDPQVRATYEYVLEQARFGNGTTARDLAEKVELKINAASNRLAKTADAGLIYRADRESVSGGGAQHVYVPVA